MDRQKPLEYAQVTKIGNFSHPQLRKKRKTDHVD